MSTKYLQILKINIKKKTSSIEFIFIYIAEKSKEIQLSAPLQYETDKLRNTVRRLWLFPVSKVSLQAPHTVGSDVFQGPRGSTRDGQGSTGQKQRRTKVTMAQPFTSNVLICMNCSQTGHQQQNYQSIETTVTIVLAGLSSWLPEKSFSFIHVRRFGL